MNAHRVLTPPCASPIAPMPRCPFMVIRKAPDECVLRRSNVAMPPEPTYAADRAKPDRQQPRRPLEHVLDNGGPLDRFRAGVQ
jgi:hypothetical protein